MISPTDYNRIARAIDWLEKDAGASVTLKQLADFLHLSEYHTQRMFKRWAGITPNQFIQALNVGRARQLLEASRSVLDASYEIGLSGPGRLHDQMINVLAMSPGEYKRQGAGLSIRYGLIDSPFGDCLVGRTNRGICNLAFMDSTDSDELEGFIRERYRRATLIRDDGAVKPLESQLFQRDPVRLPALHLSGTNFQIQVWQALLTIPPGRLLSYGDIAERVGRITASRAVGQAVGANPISWLIPCHRIIQNSGIIGHYRWGSTRKKAMLAFESSSFDQ